ncbi:MAG: hypothetical protein WDO15_04520 [Bacteroidota bacterium]
MRKLEDIPKKTPFKVPDGYFDQLPAVIQSRMAKETGTSFSQVVSFSLKFALPVIALVVAGIFWLRPAPVDDPLNGVDTEQIALFLNNTELVEIDDTHDQADFTKNEIDQLTDSIYSNIEYSNEDIFDDIDLDNL